jgi:hypothetical protein
MRLKIYYWIRLRLIASIRQTSGAIGSIPRQTVRSYYIVRAILSMVLATCTLPSAALLPRPATF